MPAPTSSTSCCAAVARPCSRIAWRAIRTMVQQLGYLKETPSQTAGPYVHIGCTPNFAEITGVYETDLGISMVNDKTLGERITVRGRIFDGTGTPLRDALVEIWQADSKGLYNSPAEMRG